MGGNDCLFEKEELVGVVLKRSPSASVEVKKSMKLKPAGHVGVQSVPVASASSRRRNHYSFAGDTQLLPFRVLAAPDPDMMRVEV